MESKPAAMLVTMVIVMVMGNFLAETEAQKIPFKQCYPACLVECNGDSKFLNCPLTCLKTCLPPTPSTPSPSSLSEKTIDQTDDFCKLGCAVHHCASLSSIVNPNEEKGAAWVDSCMFEPVFLQELK